MNITELNKFIDYDQIFEYLFNEQKDILIEHRYEARHYQTLLDFYDEKSKFDLEIEECAIDNTKIQFLFTHSLNNANESNPLSDVESYYIIFDLDLEEFTTCDYEV